MATLAEVSLVARKSIKYGAIGLVGIMLAPLVFRGMGAIWRALNPPKPPPPTVRYGRLPMINFPVTSYATPEYKLETISGSLPNLPMQGKVYLVVINKSRLGLSDEIKAKVKSIGLSDKEDALPNNTFRFFHPEIKAFMTVNIISKGYAYQFDWTTDPTLPGLHTVPVGPQAIGEAKSFLTSAGDFPEDVANGSTRLTYLEAKGTAMVPTDNINQANFTRVDFFRADKDKWKFVTMGGDTSPINIIFSGLPGNKRVVQVNYQYSQIMDNDNGTYPLKGVAAAWKELQEGRGYIAKYIGDQVTVRKASLAYLEANEPQQFIQPVYVFEGDGGFMAYVPAITAQWLTN